MAIIWLNILALGKELVSVENSNDILINRSKRACIQDISWIMKLENLYLEIIEFVSPSQINQGKVVDMCERKFKS